MPQPPAPRANIPFDDQAEPEYWFDSKEVAFTTDIAWACTVHHTERPDEGFRRTAAVSYGKTQQIQDLLEADVPRDDLDIDHRKSGALAKPHGMDIAIHVLYPDDALMITTLDRLGRSTQKMLELAEDLRKRSTPAATS